MNASTTSAARVSLGGVVRGEWIKARGLRSIWWVVVLSIVVPLLVIVVWALNATPTSASASAEADAVLGSVTSSIFETLVLFVLLGALVGTSEYETRTITTTMAAVPRRWPVVVAKSVVVAAIALVVSAIVLPLGVLIAAALVPTTASIGFGAPGILSAIAGTALFQVSAAVIGVNLGLILRSSIGAIAGTFGFLYVLPGAINLVPLTPFEKFADTFPGPASDALTALIAPADALPYGTAAVAVLAWTAVWLAVALWVVRQKDV